MPAKLFSYLFVAGLLAQEVIRFPHRRRNQRARREKRFVVDRSAGFEVALSLVALVGMEVIPLFYAFTNWLDPYDYRIALPAWLGWLGVVVLAAAIWLLWRAHRDLGLNWSPTLQIVPEHRLVTAGVYRYLRHPIYASLLLTGIAQALMLPNWIAGWSGLLAFVLVYFGRVPREEQMMVEQFGNDYTAYMQRTGGIVPRQIRR